MLKMKNSLLMYRHLMCFIFILLALIISACTHAIEENYTLEEATVWDGCTDWTFRVSVYDQDTMTPVPNAIISIIVKNEDSFGDIESFIKCENKCVTDLDGFCDLTGKFSTYGIDSTSGSEAYVNFKHRNLFVDAKGYKPLNVPLKTFIDTPYKLPSEDEHVKTTHITVKLDKVDNEGSN
jgi:hypothetical protein